MSAPRSTIALRSERVSQLHLMAEANKMPLTHYLEELIRKQARREEIPLPGLVIRAGSQVVRFGFQRTNDGEEIPVTTLTPGEARLIAKHLLAAMETPRCLFNPIETESKKLIDIGRQGIAATVDVILKNDASYRKSLSASMVKDVADWLKAAATAAEDA